MMVDSKAHSVKSLNTSGGSKRFVFKTFSQRVEEIEIDVFRNFERIKTEPSDGSSFFRESLLEWRELNTAADFISIYEEMMPWVQTLPQILLYKETIVSKLLCRLKMKARLSLEPILRLLAALSRDLLVEFLPFLPKITHSLLCLLKDGGDREPEILEQMFTSISYIMMHLQKYLIQDIVKILKITLHLRYYPKDYIQEFMAEVVSFLLRNTSTEQLIKGLRKIILEVVKKPSPLRKDAASALLWRNMRGTSTKFHSRAEQVLRLLFDSSTFSIGNKNSKGPECVGDVIAGALERACEELPSKELSLVLDCLYEEISSCIGNKSLLHLTHLLPLLKSIVQFHQGIKINDYRPLLELVGSFVQIFTDPSSSMQAEEYYWNVFEEILKIMLAILEISQLSSEPFISRIAAEWAPLFELRTSSLLDFLKGLLLKDSSVLFHFKTQIIRVMDDLIETSPEEVLYLMMMLFDKLHVKFLPSERLDEWCKGKTFTIQSFFHETIHKWVRLVKDTEKEFNDGLERPNIQFGKLDVALFWAVLNCFPCVFSSKADTNLVITLVDALDQLLLIETDIIADLPRSIWLSLLGAALMCYHKMDLGSEAALSETSKFLHLAKKYKSSPQVLSAVAEFLDSVFGSTDKLNTIPKLCHSDLDAEKAIDSINIFADNLSCPDKAIRVSTLRILCHHEFLYESHGNDQSTENNLMKDNVCHDSHSCDVLKILLLIEMTPISISTTREITRLISRIHMTLVTGKISKSYVSILLDGIIGILYNRFSHLWQAASECLTIVLEKYYDLVWDKFIEYIEKRQLDFIASLGQPAKGNFTGDGNLSVLVCSFNSYVSPSRDCTPSATVLSFLLQALQKNSVLAESHSRQIVPLFFMFLGCNDADVPSGKISCDARDGKEWRLLLKDWLDLLKVMKNTSSLYQVHNLKKVLIYRLLDEADSDIQMKVLDCLLNWKDQFLLPYENHLKNLIICKNLREELATWSVSKESQLIQDEHRSYLVPILIQILLPKVKKLKGHSSRKQAGVQNRRAVLCFLSNLDVSELTLFFSLIVKPLVSHRNHCSDPQFSDIFGSNLHEYQDHDLVNWSVFSVANFSWKKSCAFLHVMEDILRTFDGLHVAPFLNMLMAFVVGIFENSASNLIKTKHSVSGEAYFASEKHATSKQFKELRSLCLKVISFVLNKYENHDFDSGFWDRFFASVKPLIDSFKQEESRNEKPSSLLSCFITISRSPMLVSHLKRVESLVPEVFSILTVKASSDAITTAVLCFIENLLILENDMVSHEKSSIKEVLLPHIDELITCLYDLFQRHKESKRKLKSTLFRKNIFVILQHLAKHIKDPMMARKFVGILLTFLSKNSSDSTQCVETLNVIQQIMPVLNYETTEEMLISLSSLLVSAGLDVRLCICDIFDCLILSDSSIGFLAKLIRKLNAISSKEMGEIDYDLRLNGYEEITEELFSTIKKDHTLVLLSQCVYDMSSEDLIFRQCASRTLLTFIKFASSVLNETKGSERVNQAVDLNWTSASIYQIINKFFLRHMGEAMSKEMFIQKEWVVLLRDIIPLLPEVPSIYSLRPLSNEDVDVDFFHNILHLQKHRRVRAMLRFQNAITAGNLSESTIKTVFLPLFWNMLFDINVKDGKGEHIRNVCLDTIASVAGHMQWATYHTLLLKCLKEMSLKPEKKKFLSRLMCSILDKFHFSETSEKEMKDVKPSSPGVSKRNSAFFNSDYGVSHEIQLSLQKTILPKVQKLLDSDSEKVNVTISLAVLKLLKLLPRETKESQLPSIIHRVSNFLKNRLESVRDEARSALAVLSVELGFEYIQFIVKVLRGTLKRGYELHVLGYTLHFILSKLMADPIMGKLDYCLGDLLLVVENDILGDVGEEKEVDKIASKMKETRKSKSYETLKTIAQSITFKTHAMKLLFPIKNHLHQHLTPKTKCKLEKMLCHIADGIEINQSVDQTDLFVFVFGLIEDGNSEEKLCSAQNSHLLSVFALGILSTRLKKIKLDKNDETILSMLDPFVTLLAECLNSKYGDILLGALKCLAPLMRLSLPSLPCYIDRIKDLLLDIAQKTGNSNSPLMDACLKLLMVILRDTRSSLSNDQLRMLIQFPLFVDLQTKPSSVALSLLKAVVSRKLVVPEVYDLANQIGELMVTSQLEPIRKKCSKILLQFLLDYRLSEKRLQQHLDFFLKNLSYEHADGREAVVEMIYTILRKFPTSIVDAQADTLFLHLVVCLNNDQENKVRLMICEAIKVLVDCISPHIRCSILEYTISWYMGEKQNLWGPAAEVLGLLVKILKKNQVNMILQVTKRILALSLKYSDTKLQDYTGDTLVPFWRETYCSLVMLDKFLIHFPDLHLVDNLEEIWEMILTLLMHPHSWIRKISIQLIGSYFVTVSEVMKLKHENNSSKTFLLMKPDKLFRAAALICCQLKHQIIDDITSNLIIQNLAFCLCGLQTFVEREKFFDLRALSSSEQEYLIKSVHILGAKNVQETFQNFTLDDNDEKNIANLHIFFIVPFLQRMGNIALRSGDNKMKIVFNCFGLISSRIDPENLNKYVLQMLIPLYKVSEGFSGKFISDEIKQLATETIEKIRMRMEVDKFIQVYNEIRHTLKTKREKRRQEEKLMAVTDPVRNAKRKLRIAAKHRAHKKRKIMSMKMGRYSHFCS